jgi:hypothetical protein
MINFYTKFAYSMLNHRVALLKPQFPQFNVELVSWYRLPEIVSALLTTLNWGRGGDEIYVMFSLFSSACSYEPAWDESCHEFVSWP